MRQLLINPLEHEIDLYINTFADGLGLISLKFGDVSGEVCLTAKEAERIGKWFCELAKEIKKHEGKTNDKK